MKELNILEKLALGVLGVAVSTLLYMVYKASTGAVVDEVRFIWAVAVVIGSVVMFSLVAINSGIWGRLCHCDIKIYCLLWAFIVVVCLFLHKDGVVDFIALHASSIQQIKSAFDTITEWLIQNLLRGA